MSFIRLLSLTRGIARRARQDLKRLERRPVQDWAEAVRRSHSRLKSRAFAELLLEESRARVRTDPRNAQALAALIPRSLGNSERRWRQPWVRILAARAQAHEANALRVAGDLPAAGALFADLRKRLARKPLADPATRAEILSLEASYAIDQRILGYAEVLLASAADLYEQVDDTMGLAKVLIQLANLLQTRGNPERIAPLLEQAAGLFDPTEHPTLHLATVQGRLNAFLDLGDTRSASALFRAEGQVYLDGDDPFMAAMHRLMEGRLALAQARHEEAIRALSEVRRRQLALDRHYDAILASLYLADALLAAGRLEELRSLARDLVQLFEAQGVEREMLASLQLLAKANAAENVLAAIIADLRRKITEDGPRLARAGG